jgi:hypothetical protein
VLNSKNRKHPKNIQKKKKRKTEESTQKEKPPCPRKPYPSRAAASLALIVPMP